MLTPEQVVREAAEIGLYAVGIVDHDTIGGIEPALAVAEDAGVVVVPGIEINTDVEQDEIHILGYYMDHRSAPFRERIDMLRAGRYERGKRMVEQLNALGIGITFDRVKEIADGASIGRPHVARAIVEAGCVRSINGAFGKFLVRGAPGYVARYKLTPVEAVEIIRESGGVPVLAHPGHGRLAELMLPELIQAGLRGIEVYHTDHTAAQSKWFRRLAEKTRMIITGGSDSHGPGMMKDTPVGNVTIDGAVVEQLQAAAEEIRASKSV
jgi:hypothetical protein